MTYNPVHKHGASWLIDGNQVMAKKDRQKGLNNIVKESKMLPPCWHNVSLLVYAVKNTWRKYQRNQVSTLNDTTINNRFQNNKFNEHARYVFILIQLLFMLQINHDAMFELCCSQSYMLPCPSESMISCSEQDRDSWANLEQFNFKRTCMYSISCVVSHWHEKVWCIKWLISI